jgi:hypothetical protein
MANSTPAGIVIEYDNSGGTLVDITQHVLTINDIDIESIHEEKHTFGDSWEETLAIGIAKMMPIELTGLYDDTATTGPDALFAGRAPETTSTATRTFRITWNSTPKRTAVETYLKIYGRKADRNALSKYKAVLQPTGTVTET